MDYELPSEFDLIVVGTGMIESIVAAAASRIGKHVLHIDSNNYYGGLWTSFNLDSINKIENEEISIDGVIPTGLNDGEKIYKAANNGFDMHVHKQTWNVPESVVLNNQDNISETNSLEEQTAEVEEHSEKEFCWTKEELLKNSRKFNIDIAPKLHFARGDFVELLISSNIARYSEFRSVSRVLTFLNGELEVVPCSRSDVFSSTKVSVIEKRMLMKVLTACVDGNPNEFLGYENKTFKTFLKDRNLTENLMHYVTYAIAMSTDLTPCLEGVENTKRFLTSLGRFGKTPFLYSMYGSGEITQAFCRLSAVFGGVYALSRSINGFIFDEENRFKSMLCGQQRISADHLVVDIRKLPEEFINFSTTNFISRAIFITDSSIMKSDKENLTLLIYPPENNKPPCTIIEVGTLTGTCPKDLYVLHIFTKHSVNPEEDLKHCVNNIFPSTTGDVEAAPPRILWSFYYKTPETLSLDVTSGVPKNVFVCPGPDLDLDCDLAIRKAKEIFNEIYPNLEFLPRAPDPEEIIIGEDNNNVEEENGVAEAMRGLDIENGKQETIESDKLSGGDDGI